MKPTMLGWLKAPNLPFAGPKNIGDLGNLVRWWLQEDHGGKLKKPKREEGVKAGEQWPSSLCAEQMYSSLILEKPMCS